MVASSELITALENIGGTDCEIAVQPLGFGRELLRVGVTTLSANNEHRVINVLGQHISNIAPSQVSYGNADGLVRLNGVYFIPAGSVTIDAPEPATIDDLATVEQFSEQVVSDPADQMAESVDTEIAAKSAAKRKGK